MTHMVSGTWKTGHADWTDGLSTQGTTKKVKSCKTKRKTGLGCSLGVEHLLSMQEALSSVPSTRKQEPTKQTTNEPPTKQEEYGNFSNLSIVIKCNAVVCLEPAS